MESNLHSPAAQSSQPSSQAPNVAVSGEDVGSESILFRFGNLTPGVQSYINPRIPNSLNGLNRHKSILIIHRLY
jgi:hypothetical protein